MQFDHYYLLSLNQYFYCMINAVWPLLSSTLKCFFWFIFRVFSSKVLTPKCHLLLLTVFCDRKVFPKAMKGFKSRGEESWKLAQCYSTKVPLVRFPIACDVRGNRGSPSLLLPFKDIQRTYCWPIENAKITMLTFFQQNPLWSILDTKYQKNWRLLKI